MGDIEEGKGGPRLPACLPAGLSLSLPFPFPPSRSALVSLFSPFSPPPHLPCISHFPFLSLHFPSLSLFLSLEEGASLTYARALSQPVQPKRKHPLFSLSLSLSLSLCPLLRQRLLSPLSSSSSSSVFAQTGWRTSPECWWLWRRRGTNGKEGGKSWWKPR